MSVGSSFTRVDAHLSGADRELDLSFQITEGKRKYFLNGKLKRTAELKGLIPSVTFTPDDLDLAKGSSAVRRDALDALGSQLSSNHYLIRKDYEKVIRHKNRLLKEEADPSLIDAIDEMLVTCGSQLTCYRSALFSKLFPLVAKNYETISEGKESLSGCYMPSWIPAEFSSPSVDVSLNALSACSSSSMKTSPQNFMDEPSHKNFSTAGDDGEGNGECFVVGGNVSRETSREELARALREKRNDEVARKRSLVGPHADKIEWFIGGKEIGSFASQGQQRSAVLAYKLAEAALIEEMLHQKPVLLLDDVMSELDEHRRSSLMSAVSSDSQTFITTAHLAYFDDELLSRAQVIELPREQDRRC